MLLKVDKLNVFRGTAHIIRDISFEIEKGEAIGIVGPNGSGKTTLMMGLMGLLPIKSGRIYFNNQEITNLPPFKRAQLGIGYVPEDRRLYPELNVKQNIAIPCWAKKMREPDESFGEDIFPIVKVRDLVRRKSGAYLSGGEQMIISILRALAAKPILLLLDECFEGIFAVARRYLAEYLTKKKNEEGLTVICTESNPNFINWVDKTYRIERGELKEI
ncbi:MAG: ATP-binding cassette domain-containing protein [Desulfurococcaceae archaeon]